MPNSNLNVSLDLSGPQGSKRIGVGDGIGQNQIPADPSAPTTISWTLTGPIAQANFVPMDAAQPGFQWAYPIGQQGGPPQGLMDNPPPQISNEGNTLTVTDNHFNNNSNGQWIYILRIIYNGFVYSTVFSPNAEDDDDGDDDDDGLSPDTVKNPVIINR